MFFLAPPIALLLEVCHGHAEGQRQASEVTELLPQARAFVQESRHLFELSRPSILQDKEVKEMLNQVRLELEAQELALREIERTAKEGKPHGVADHSSRLESASRRLIETYGKLSRRERQEKVYSPAAVLDQVIRVGINLLNKHVDAFELRSRLPTAADVVRQMSQQVKLFGLLYSAPELQAEGTQAAAALEAGLGAVALYFESGKDSDLLDGLKLLGSSSTVLHGTFAKMHEFTKSRQKYSSFPYLEEFCRALEELGDHPALVRGCWGRVEESFVHYRRTLATLEAQPVALKYENHIRQITMLLTLLEQNVSATAGRLVDPLPALTELKIETLQQSFESVHQAMQALWKLLEEEAEAISKTPLLEVMREVLCRAQQGAVPNRVLRDYLLHWRRSHQQLQLECQKKPGPLQQRMLGLLMSHSAAFDCVEEFLANGDRGQLRRAFELVDPTIGPLGELGQELQKQVRPARAKAKRTVNCFRCGQENKNDRRVCSSCGAVLPALPTGPEETFEITAGGGDGGGAPENVLEFLDLLTVGAENNQIPRPKFEAAIDDLLRQASMTRKQFEAQLIPKMGRNTELDAYLQVFAQAIGGYVQGLLALREFQTLNQLHSASAQAKDAAEALRFMKESIDEAMQRS